MSFPSAFRNTVGMEGRYSNNLNDSGGETMFGITSRVARANGYAGAMDQMPIDTARMIYKSQYWDLLKLDNIVSLSERVADELFDTAVNCGAGVAGGFFQSTLNVLNLKGTLYADMKVDGIVGPVTVAAFRAFLGRRGMQGEVVMLKALNCLQGARYVGLAEKREKDEEFVYGWLLNRVAL